MSRKSWQWWNLIASLFVLVTGPVWGHWLHLRQSSQAVIWLSLGLWNVWLAYWARPAVDHKQTGKWFNKANAGD